LSTVEFSFIENKHARLSIPFGDKQGFTWRLRLIKKHRPDDFTELVELTKATLAKKWTVGHSKTAQSLAKSVKIDDVERAEMLAAHCLRYPEKMTTKQVLFYHPQAKLEVDVRGSAPDQTADAYRHFLVTSRNGIYKHLMPPIRAKLAVLELLCLMPDQPTLIQLVEFSPQYLSDSFVIKWIRRQRHLAQFGASREKTYSKTRLKQLHKAIIGDQRKRRKGSRSKWHAHLLYLDMVDNFADFRRRYRCTRLQKEKVQPSDEFDRTYFDIYCDTYKVSKLNRERVLSKGTAQGISDIVLDTLIARKLTPSEQVFRKTHAEFEKLRIRHNWIGTDIIEQFLDAIPSHPELSSTPIEHCLKYVN
jgi:hypothetical protein